jgi:prepilin-type N-terminal cleavage/methylation domain-containing protein
MRHLMKKNNSKAAFTLIELLVVISVILIASSIVFIGGNSGGGAKLSSSQRIVSGIAQGARGQAILKNAKSRLIIYTDVTSNIDDEKKLRYFGIVYENTDPAATDEWFAATQGTFLPKGIYFNKALSKGRPEKTMNLEFPRQSAQSEGSGDEFYYYEFNSNGTMATGFNNAWLALQAGVLKPKAGGGALEVNFDDEENTGLKAALIFRRTGTTTLVKNPLDV